MVNTNESSLTTPEDRDLENKWKPELSQPPLTELEAGPALEELNKTDFIKKFPRIDRTYQDPPIPMQNIGLISFIPAKGAQPNSRGVFGFAKLRGNYASFMEADQRAEYLIRNVDSYNPVFHAYVGRPFPITVSSDYSAETQEIDIRKEATECISSNIKEHKDRENKIIKEIKDKEESLLLDSKKAREAPQDGEVETDPYDEYITLNVKKAQLSWTFLEHINKLNEVRSIIIKTREGIKELDEKYPEFKITYFEKYMQARKEAGLDTQVENIKDNFIKYMVEDVELPTIDTDEVLPGIVKLD